MISPMLAGIASTVANKYSEDLSAWTKRGVARRKAKGLPTGQIPFGHTVKRELNGSQLVTERIPDPATAPVVNEMFSLADNGTTPGEIARTLNERGILTARGKRWDRRGVLIVLRNPLYTGQRGYEQIVDRALWERVNQQLQRRDPAASQRRAGGRPPRHDSLLRGIAFCGQCEAPLYTKSNGKGARFYVCRERNRGSDLCTARTIPAELIEQHVIDHLEFFVGDVQDWLAEQVQERRRDAGAQLAQLDAQRAQLADLDRKRALVFADYERLLADGDPLARYSLEALAGIDQRRDEQARAIQDMEAIAAEWSADAGPDMDAVLDFYRQLVDLVRGKISAAEGAQALNAALASVLTGVWLDVNDGELTADFRLNGWQLLPPPGCEPPKPSDSLRMGACTHPKSQSKPSGVSTTTFPVAAFASM
jgi:hypothetical protein